MSPSTSTDHQIIDHSFSTLMLGVFIGAAGALLFGTKEGKQLLTKVLDNLPDNFTKVKSSTPAAEPSKPLIASDDYRSAPPAYPSISSDNHFPTS